MNRIIFLIFFFVTYSFSTEFYLNPYFENKLQKDTRSYSIINNYIKFLNEISSLDKKNKIDKVNRYINAIIPKYDVYNYKNEEYWATPYEFFSNGGGDCEDYVIAKKYTLTLLGIPSENMYFSIVKEKYIGGDHMVLGLHVKSDNSFMVLDNLSTKVLSFEKRVDLKPIFLFNANGFYRLNKKQDLVKIDKISIAAYNDFRKRNNRKLVLVK